MESLPRALNYELSHDLHFGHFAGAAQQILENGKSAAEASTPTITTLDALANNEFLQKIGATILNSIHLKNQKLSGEAQEPKNFSESAMDIDFSNHVVLDSTSVNQLQQQLEYDKFMNEVWIGVVFTLILISMVFCICSCFLYHQFRTWKRNYNTNGSNSQCTLVDVEALKLHPNTEDPVPEYTLVSGLPSYEAALELLHKTPQSSCLIVYPSVFNVFNRHEKASTELPTATSTPPTATTQQNHESAPPQTPQQQSQHSPQTPQSLCEATTPLLATTTVTPTPTTAAAAPTCETIKPNFVLPIVPSYAEVFGSYKIIDEKSKSGKAASPATEEDTQKSKR